MTHRFNSMSLASAVDNVNLFAAKPVQRPAPRAPSNPYLKEFLALPDSYRGRNWEGDYRERQREPEFLNCRQRMVEKFSWAVPNDAAIAAIARLAPRVVEIGAGNGYWARLLSEAGVDVIAFDHQPPSMPWHPVQIGGIETIPSHSDRALLICWPPRLSSMATQALHAFHGSTLVYVGEFMRGSADPWFFVQLWHEWREVDRVEIPRWFNRLDDLRIFKCRSAAANRCRPGA